MNVALLLLTNVYKYSYILSFRRIIFVCVCSVLIKAYNLGPCWQPRLFAPRLSRPCAVPAKAAQGAGRTRSGPSGTTSRKW